MLRDGPFAPARTPVAITAQVQTAFRLALGTPKLRETFANGGYEVVCDAPESFARFVRAEMQRYGEQVAIVGIKPE